MEALKKIFDELSPWKAVQPDGVQGYWVQILPVILRKRSTNLIHSWKQEKIGMDDNWQDSVDTKEPKEG